MYTAIKTERVEQTNSQTLGNNTVFASLESKPKVRDLRFRRRHTAQQRAYNQYAKERNELINLGFASEAENLNIPRSFWCGHKVQENTQYVDVRRDMETGTAKLSNIKYCGAVWTCPVCSSIIRNERAKDVQKAVDVWQKQGKGLYLVTATLRHFKADNLAISLDTLTNAWRSTVSGKQWQQFRIDFGIVGYVRSLEITYSDTNGWHPHFHFLFFVDGKATKSGEYLLNSVLLDRWKHQVIKHGGRLPNSHGIDVRLVDENGKAAAQYVSKIVDGNNVSLELARADLKAASDEFEAITPFQLLDADTPKYRALWSAYTKAIKGKRSVFFSRGLRELLGIEKELSNDEIIEKQQRIGELISSFEADVYQTIVNRKDSLLGDVLNLIEIGQFVQAADLIGCRLDVRERRDCLTGEIVFCFTFVKQLFYGL